MAIAAVVLFVLSTIFSLANAKEPIKSNHYFNSLERPLTASSLFNECENADPSSLKVDLEKVELWKSCLALKRLKSIPPKCEGLDLSGPPLDSHNDPRLLIPNCLSTQEHVDYLETRLDELCVNAGEKIYKIAEDVEGVFIMPAEKSTSGILHQKEIQFGSYVNHRSGRHYWFWEHPSYREEGKYKKTNIKYDTNARIPQIKHMNEIIEKPTALHGVRIESLLDKKENRKGLYGNKLTIYELETNDILAERTLYHYEIKNHLERSNGSKLYLPRAIASKKHYVATCRNYSVELEREYNDHIPRSSYSFVVKVLNPKPIEEELSKSLFHLAKGSGVKEELGSIITLGPYIYKDDIGLTKNEKGDLIVSLKETDDQFVSKKYFIKQQYNSTRITFYNGEIWDHEDVMINLKDN